MLSDISKYRSIAEQIALSIQMGLFSNGDKLPPQRKFAAQCGVTLGCVTRAYALLEAQGLVTARLGDGTYVNYSPVNSKSPACMNMAFNAPAEHPTVLSAFQRVLADIAADDTASSELLAYPSELGLQRHRAAVAKWLQRLATSGQSHRVMLTNGAQHSIACVIRTLMRPGDVLLTQSLTYHGLFPLEQELRLQSVGVECDAEGLMPDALERAARTHGAKVLYCIPSLHMPTTVTMSMRRRHEIAAVVKRNHLLVIEDCVHALGMENPLPALSSLLPAQSFLVGSFSKWTTPVLRVGFVEADPKWLGKIALALRADSLASSVLMAEVLFRWMESGDLERLVQVQRSMIAARHAAAQCVMDRWAQKFPGTFVVKSDPSFPFIWLTWSGPMDAEQIAQRLLQQEVLVRTSAHFRVGRTKSPQGLRISIGAPQSTAQMLQGLELVLSAAVGINPV